MPKKVSLEKQTSSTEVTQVRSFAKLLICLSEPIELEKRKRRIQGIREVAQCLFQELIETVDGAVAVSWLSRVWGRGNEKLRSSTPS